MWVFPSGDIQVYFWMLQCENIVLFTNKLWPESTSKLYPLSDCRLSAKLVPTFAARGCHMVSVTDPYDCILGFLDRSRYFLFQVAPQLYSWGWVDPVPDPLLLRKSGSAGNRTRTSGSVARNSWVKKNAIFLLDLCTVSATVNQEMSGHIQKCYHDRWKYWLIHIMSVIGLFLLLYCRCSRNHPSNTDETELEMYGC
jgi:hypothetical protein